MPIDLPAPYVPQVDWAYSEAGSGNEDRLKILFVGNFRGTGIPLEVPLSVQNSRELLRFWAPSIDLDLEVVLDGVHERVCMRYQPVDIQSFLSPLSACTFLTDPIEGPAPNPGILNLLRGLSNWNPLQKEIRMAMEAPYLTGAVPESASVELQEVIDELRKLRGDGVSESEALGLDQVYLRLSELYESVQNSITENVLFTEMKASWLGMDRILNAGMNHQSIEIWALNASPGALLDDCDLDVANTDLFSAIYQSEIGQYGGEPFSCVVVGFPFEFMSGRGPVYQYLAKIGEFASTPILVDPQLSLLKADNYSVLDGLENIEIDLDSSLWDIASESCGSFLFLTPQSSVVEVRHGTDSGDEVMNQSLAIFDCPGSVDLIINLMESLVDLRSVVSDFQQNTLDYEVRPVYWFGPRIVETLQSKGMTVPLCVHPQRPLSFETALPIAGIKGGVSGDKGSGIRPPELIGLVQILRILHKLKEWARDNIGSATSANERVAAINEQINTFVLDSPKPRQELLRLRPLSAGHCELVEDLNAIGDSYRLSFRLHEHHDYPEGELTTHVGMG